MANECFIPSRPNHDERTDTHSAKTIFEKKQKSNCLGARVSAAFIPPTDLKAYDNNVFICGSVNFEHSI